LPTPDPAIVTSDPVMAVTDPLLDTVDATPCRTRGLGPPQGEAHSGREGASPPPSLRAARDSGSLLRWRCDRESEEGWLLRFR
jgi:hypothetical protein